MREAALYLGDIGEKSLFLYRPPLGVWFVRAVTAAARCRPTMGALLPGMPVEIQRSADGHTLLSWKPEGQTGRGWDVQGYMERHGMTYATRAARFDVRPWLRQAVNADGSVDARRAVALSRARPVSGRQNT